MKSKVWEDKVKQLLFLMFLKNSKPIWIDLLKNVNKTQKPRLRVIKSLLLTPWTCSKKKMIDLPEQKRTKKLMKMTFVMLWETKGIGKFSLDPSPAMLMKGNWKISSGAKRFVSPILESLEMNKVNPNVLHLVFVLTQKAQEEPSALMERDLDPNPSESIKQQRDDNV